MYQLAVRFWFIASIVLAVAARSNCQSDLPEVFKEGTISEQMKYLDEHTRIYENYRAIREDMYRSIRRNALDSLTKAKGRITGLLAQTTLLDNRIDSLNRSLEATSNELTEKTRTKNSIGILGIEVNKAAYNSLMWSVLGALVLLLVIGFLSFKQNRSVTIRTLKDLDELNAEFEAYRTKTRLEREKTAIDHFNEIKRLKGK
jgi:hypothetical protein